ncbi:MAG TPA: DinB family protein [Pyrinomonadaceae bacterium]|jgi:hypothetical protein
MKEVLEDFRLTIETAAARLLLLPDEQTRAPRSAGKWSPREIIGHLIDSASNNHQRFVRAQLSEDLIFPGYDQEAWVAVQCYNEESWPLLVRLWQAYNLHLMHLMSKAPEETRRRLRAKHNLDQIAWQRVDRSEPATLEYFMRDYIAHLKNHLEQVFDPATGQEERQRS